MPGYPGKRNETMAHEADPDATIRVSARFDPDGDTDATERAPAQFYTHLYARAIRQESLAGKAENPPSERAKSPSPTRRFSLPTRWAKHASREKNPLRLSAGAGVILLLALLVLGTVNYTGNAGAEQGAASSKAALDRALSQARAEGVPASLLQPVVQQEQQLDGSNSFLTRLTSANALQSLPQRYSALRLRVPGIITTATGQAQAKAQQDMQTFQT